MYGGDIQSKRTRFIALGHTPYAIRAPIYHRRRSAGRDLVPTYRRDGDSNSRSFLRPILSVGEADSCGWIKSHFSVPTQCSGGIYVRGAVPPPIRSQRRTFDTTLHGQKAMFTGFYARDAPPSGILDAATIAAQGLPTDSLTPQLTISAGILSAVATLIVLFRLYGRAVILRVVGWDDYCVIIAAVSFYTHTYHLTRYGSFAHGGVIRYSLSASREQCSPAPTTVSASTPGWLDTPTSR